MINLLDLGHHFTLACFVCRLLLLIAITLGLSLYCFTHKLWYYKVHCWYDYRNLNGLVVFMNMLICSGLLRS
uniref:Uncharacterized protein n=1 Tax=Picea glauca TaxID=3330 RepID=A0A101LUK7_PICGL|nr:hypothetical protein ABT39_MTgene2468 [Picea glauca]QHR88544.1 hypothetical protein Q903MT_gene2558 [Picea sitchensis]